VTDAKRKASLELPVNPIYLAVYLLRKGALNAMSKKIPASSYQHPVNAREKVNLLPQNGRHHEAPSDPGSGEPFRVLHKRWRVSSKLILRWQEKEDSYQRIELSFFADHLPFLYIPEKALHQ
jgi:hypothetical protein